MMRIYHDRSKNSQVCFNSLDVQYMITTRRKYGVFFSLRGMADRGGDDNRRIVGRQLHLLISSCWPIPIGSMYGIYANIWGILMVNVTIYGIHTDPMGY